MNTQIRGLQIKDAFFGAGLKRNSGNNDIAEVAVDDSSIEISGDALQIKASGVTNDMLAGSIADGKLAEDYIKTSEVDGSTIEFAGGSLNVVANGIGATEIDLTDTYDYSSGTLQVGTPSANNDVANKAYVDNLVNGLQWKDPVRAKSIASDGNITLSGVSAQSLDGVSLVADDRVLLTEQTDASENGIWEVKSGAWVRPSDFPTGGDAVNATVLVSEGGDNADTQWTCTNNADADTIDTNDLAFTQISGTGSIVAGEGLTKDGNTLDVNVDDSSIEINADTLRVKALGITNAMLAGSIADDKLAEDYIKTSEVDGSSIEFAGGTLNIVSGGVTNDMLAGSIADTKLAEDYIKTSEVDGTTIEFAGGTLNIVDDGVSNAKLANMTRGTVKVGGVANAPTDLDAKTDGYILIGDGTDVNSVAVSGDVTITNAGVTAIGATKVTDAMINDDVATGLAGTGLSASGGVMAVDLSELSSAVVDVANDEIVIIDATDGSTKKESIDDLVQAMTAGANGIGYGTGADAGKLFLNFNDLASADIAGSDVIAFSDASDSNVHKQETVTDLATFMAGNGISASSGVLAVDLNELAGAVIDTSADSIPFVDATDSSSKLESVADFLTAIAGIGVAGTGGQLHIAFHELTDVAIDVSADSIAFLDATDSNTRRETVADLVTAMAGSGLTATNGVLSVDAITDNVVESDIQVENESANCNGVTTQFTLSNTPVTNSVQVFLNGLLQEAGSGKDYTLTGTTVEFAEAPISGDILIIHYIINN